MRIPRAPLGLQRLEHGEDGEHGKSSRLRPPQWDPGDIMHVHMHDASPGRDLRAQPYGRRCFVQGPVMADASAKGHSIVEQSPNLIASSPTG